MAVFRPFRGMRPVPALAGRVAALPYDVMSSPEARQMAQGNPYSFLHVDKAEIDLDPSVAFYDPRVYEKAAANLKQMEAEGVYLCDEKPCFYIYRQVMDGRSQTGLVGCAAISDYLENHVKKHELTRADKEADRIRHVDACNANTGPIFLTYRAREDVSRRIHAWTENHAPVYDFTAEDGVSHTVWVVDSDSVIEALQAALAQVPDFYIADGHHRAASAVRVGLKRRQENPGYTGEEEFNFFLAALFPDTELKIMAYNRVVHDLNGLTKEAFLERLARVYGISRHPGGRYFPEERHTVGMYLDGEWYRLAAKDGIFDSADPVGRLDVSILQENVLGPILGIDDPRTSGRIRFIGGIRGPEALERLVDGGEAVAFAMYPTSLDELMCLADAGRIMPPKSTWFEPKLRSGLFVHKLR